MFSPGFQGAGFRIHQQQLRKAWLDVVANVCQPCTRDTEAGKLKRLAENTNSTWNDSELRQRTGWDSCTSEARQRGKPGRT